jgi:hypothetical protein
VGWDLFGDPVYRERQAVPPPLPAYTGKTLPWYLRTLKQIRAEGLEPVGRPVTAVRRSSTHTCSTATPSPARS